MKFFNSVDESLFFTKNDSNDVRLGDLAKSLKSTDPKALPINSCVIAGYPDDSGIRINGGRLGAGHAPDTIRKYFYKTTPSYLSEMHPTVFDIGNLNLDMELEQRHQSARSMALEFLNANCRWLSLGGGHDYGFSDASAFCEHLSKSETERPLIINFDAHLDVRPTKNGFSSGTPFYRLLTEFPKIDFVEIGIQGHCNSPHHVEWLRERGGRILSMEEIRASGESFVVHVLKFLEPMIGKKRKAFLSVDIDGFSSSDAPGCSQSWATGFRSEEFFSVYQVLLKRLDVRGLGIYEVSPPLDQDDRTSKLAALILHRFLFQL